MVAELRYICEGCLIFFGFFARYGLVVDISGLLLIQESEGSGHGVKVHLRKLFRLPWLPFSLGISPQLSKVFLMQEGSFENGGHRVDR